MTSLNLFGHELVVDNFAGGGGASRQECSMSEYTQGVCQDGAAILKDGMPMTIEEILDELRHGQDMQQAASGLSADLTHFGQQLEEAQAKLAAIGRLCPTHFEDREQLLGAITRILRGEIEEEA